jgi:hypothetical protein
MALLYIELLILLHKKTMGIKDITVEPHYNGPYYNRRRL